MTRDDIIRMAREAGLSHFYDSEYHCTGITDANLIDADKERNDDRLVEMLAPFAALVAAAEREACAKVCEGNAKGYEERAARPKDARDINPEVARIAVLACGQLAAAIRARGQA